MISLLRAAWSHVIPASVHSRLRILRAALRRAVRMGSWCRGLVEVSTSQVSVSSDKFLPWCQGSDKSSHILIAKAVINFLPHKLSTTQKHNGYCSAFLFIQLWLLNCCGSSLSFLIRIFCLISFSVSFNKVNTGWDLSKRIDPSPMNSEGCCIKHRSVSVWQYDAGWLSVIHVNSRDNLMLRARVFVTCYLITQCQNLDNYLSQKSRGIIDNLIDKPARKSGNVFGPVDFDRDETRKHDGFVLNKRHVR